MTKFDVKPLVMSVSAVLSVSSLVFSPEVFAQIEEVVVTARKQSESLQEVPLAITAFSTEKMERGDFTNMEDVANNTVGLNYSGESSSGYQSSPTIRGLRQGFATDRVQNVAIFLDGVYLSRQSMANMGMVDMARIEVVKGPQNSLYGRNAFAGAINYVTKKPTEEFEAYASTVQGKDNREDYKFSITGPLIEGKLLGRYTIGYSDYDGHTHNQHPNAGIEPPGFNEGGSDKMVGGWEDKTYNLGLTWLVNDSMDINLGYYNTSLKKENAAQYTMGGVREIARFQTTPYDDLNFNPVTHITNAADKAGGGFTGLNSTGYTLWKGPLSTRPTPGVWAGGLQAAVNPDGSITYDPATEGYNWGLGDGVVGEDQRLLGVSLDPRGYGFKADTEIYTFGVNWEIDEYWSLTYLGGYVDHSGSQAGLASRDPLWGNSLTDNGPLFDAVTGEQLRQDVEMQSNVSSSRPIIDGLETQSHEFRFDYMPSDEWNFSFGGYYSDTEDSQFSQTTYNPICTTAERLYDEDQDPVSGCYIPFGTDVPGPLSEVQNQGVGIYNIFRDAWSGNQADKTIYDEQVYAAFAMAEWSITPDVSLRVEARYTEEDKRIERYSDTFALAAGEIGDVGTGVGGNSISTICTATAIPLNDGTGRRVAEDPGNPGTVYDPSGTGGTVCIEPSDEDTFHYFTPKYSIDWQVNDETLIYGYIAKGLKAGGFNNTSDPTQGVYDEEINWTYEVGTKNILFDGKMKLNASFYVVEWEDLVGSQTPNSQGENESPNAGSIQANIGDVENYGFEIEGQYYFTDNFDVDFGISYTNPRYKDDVEYAEAKTNYYFECTPENLLTDTNPDGTRIGGNFDAVIDFNENCGNGDIGGNDLIKVSKEQYILGFNYSDEFDNGWLMNLRLDGSYQSRQYVDPLNITEIRSRTLWNMSMNFQGPEHWEVTFWGKNITDKDYVSGAFALGLFNKYIVSLGSPANYGVNIKYNF